MLRRRLLQLLIAFAPVVARARSRIVVIVHPSNSVRELSKGELAAIFTTKRRHWSGDSKVFPFNAAARHPLRVAFDREVLGMGPDEVARYWIDRRIRGGHRPPRQLSSTAMMMKVVAGVEGAIGYVPEAAVDESVKVIATLSASED